MTKGSGVDLENEYVYTPEPTDGKIRVILTSRMIRNKGVMEFADAALALKNEYYGKVEFLLCGGLDTNPTAVSEEYLRQVCDGKYLQWLGYRTDIVDLLKSCHIMAFPSYREGLPKSLIEAAACGRPIITTDSVGCRDCVVDGYNGYLVPVKDTDLLAQRMETLINDREKRAIMGLNSRQLAEKEFSVEKVIAKHLEIYDTLIRL